jgi:AcrR family transcriptional regulator
MTSSLRNVQRVSHGVNLSGTVRDMATYRTAVRQTRQESRERIVAAATDLIRDTPYGALTVDDVMREAGAGRTIFYRHFDDLADLLMRAGREAFEGLYQAEQAFRSAHVDGRPNVRAAIEAAVAVYRRHGPLLRAITEAAAAGDEQIAAGQQAMLERFDALVEDVLRASPRMTGRSAEDIAETARALNVMNVNYLLDAFGREPRVSTETAVRTLTGIWGALID